MGTSILLLICTLFLIHSTSYSKSSTLRGNEFEIAVWDPNEINFVLSEYATDTLITVQLVNLWDGPMTIQDLVMEGDPAWIENTQMPMILMPAEHHEITIRYAPVKRGVHIGRLITVTDGMSDTLLLKGRASRTVKGAFWGSDTLRLVPQSCAETSQQWVELNNDGISDLLIDSVSIVGLDAGYFHILSSNPPNRLKDFVLAPSTPGNGVQYLIEFRPNGNTKPHGADLAVHTSSGVIEKTMLIGLVPVSDVVDIDTTLTDLAIGVDHVITLHVNNIGNATFNSSSAYWGGDLDATVNGLASGIQILPGIEKDVTVTLRSDVAGSRSKVIKFNGTDCDDPFEVRINAQFGDHSSVAASTLESDVHLIPMGTHILVEHSGSHPISYRVVDAIGRIVASGVVSRKGSIDVGNLSTGAYVCMLEDRVHHTLKFMHR